MADRLLSAAIRSATSQCGAGNRAATDARRGEPRPLTTDRPNEVWVVAKHGAPRHLRSDNGPESIAHAVHWLRATKIETAYIQPGKPWHHRPHGSLGYKTPIEAKAAWIEQQGRAINPTTSPNPSALIGPTN